MDGCPVAALGSDAARQGADVKASFEAGIRDYPEMLGPWVGEADGKELGNKAMAVLSTMIGAMLLSRAVDDKRLSKRFLQAAARSAARRTKKLTLVKTRGHPLSGVQPASKPEW